LTKRPGDVKPPRDLEIVRRLATDPKMRHVWNTLTKHRRASDDDLKDFIMCAFVEAVADGDLTMTRHELDARVKRLSDAAELCRQVAPGWGHSNPKLRSSALVMADCFEKFARIERGLLSPWAVEKRIRNDKARAYVRLLGAKAKELFGSTLRGTVATVASVALDQKISEQDVRNWCANSGKAAPVSLRRRK
jgi:hypothetical protein